MLIAGWGKNATPIAFVGILKCGNCRNYNCMSLYEVANELGLYFVKVARANKKYFVVCSVCENALEADRAEKDQILQESVNLPDEGTTMAIWNRLDQETAKLMNAKDDWKVQDCEDIVATLKTEFEPGYVSCVAQWFWTCVTDQDVAG